MIDYVFRFDPDGQGTRRPPANAQEARQALVEGNRVFSSWMASCRDAQAHPQDFQYVVTASGFDPASRPGPDGYPTQRPFAAVIGCSDARAPAELLFGRGFNDLFVVRVAGNVLGDEGHGSIDFSLLALSENLRVLVVLGHTNCGAVKGAVDCYLAPEKFWSPSFSPGLRLIFQRIFVAVRESDHALREVWGKDAPTQPGYREALTDLAICLNAAHTAFTLRQQVEAERKSNIGVVFGVYDVRTHQVCMPIRPYDASSPPDPSHVHLETAPSQPGEFLALANRLAETLRPSAANSSRTRASKAGSPSPRAGRSVSRKT